MMRAAASRRSGYHHGDLRNALTDAATDLARAGGPDAVVLREAARRVGVSATAAYRHFASHIDLFHAVKERALLALAEAMQKELAAVPNRGDRVERALARFRAVGVGYIRFALTEPGLFRIACDRRAPAPPPGAPDRPWAGTGPFQLLAATLDELVACGRLDPARRPFTDVAAWASVHGMSLLLLDGPLARLAEKEREAAIARQAEIFMAGI